MAKKKNSFSGSLGFVLAAAGSAVGVGNIWRFPYLCAKDGGGLFLLVYLVLVATNQSGIGRGMFSEDDFERLTEYMRGVFRSSGAEIAGVFHCPSADDGHPDRKPNPGLFLKAAAAHGLDMKACVSVGDRERDIRAALAAGVGRNFLFSAEDVPTLATARVETLEEVAARL